jgi:hypothetical protein
MKKVMVMTTKGTRKSILLDEKSETTERILVSQIQTLLSNFDNKLLSLSKSNTINSIFGGRI